MGKRWQHIRGALARRIRYKITRGGMLFTAAILLVSLAALVSTNNLLFLIAAAMMATLMVSGLVSRLCLAELDHLFVVPEHHAENHSVPGNFFLENQKWLKPFFSIHMELVRDPAN